VLGSMCLFFFLRQFVSLLHSNPAEGQRHFERPNGTDGFFSSHEPQVEAGDGKNDSEANESLPGKDVRGRPWHPQWMQTWGQQCVEWEDGFVRGERNLPFELGLSVLISCKRFDDQCRPMVKDCPPWLVGGVLPMIGESEEVFLRFSFRLVRADLWSRDGVKYLWRDVLSRRIPDRDEMEWYSAQYVKRRAVWGRVWKSILLLLAFSDPDALT
jgi:hypothetical protein